MIERRDVVVCVLLTIFTCGIYGIYWHYKLLQELYTANDQMSNAGTDILLTIVTCGIYGIYTYYKMGQMAATARQRLGLPFKDDSSMFLVFGILTYFVGVLFLVVFAMVQSDLNDFIAPAYYNRQAQFVTQNNYYDPNFPPQ